MPESRKLRTPKIKPRYVSSLDGLRALCALGVVGYHMRLPWCGGGLLGVTILFVLSGYLVTAGLMREFSTSRGHISLGSFWVRRFWRLMPTVVLFVAVTGAVCSFLSPALFTKMRGDIIPGLLMVINWTKILSNESYFAAAGNPSPLTHFWSLAIEAQFYFVWPPIFYLLMRKRVRRRGVCIGLLVASLASAALMAFLYVPGADPSRAYYGTDTRAMSLLLGCWLAIAWPFDRMSRQVATRLHGVRGLIPRVVGPVCLLGLIAMMLFTEGYSAFSYYGGILLCSVVTLGAIAGLVPDGSIFSRILSFKPLAWIGSRSYAIYLWHYPILELMNPLNATTGVPWWKLLLELALILGISELSYRFVEVPFRALGKKPVSQGRKQGSSIPWLKLTPAIVLTLVGTVATIVGLVVVKPVTVAGNHPEERRVMQASLKKPVQDGVYDVVLIGDSVSLGANEQLNQAFPHGLIDTKGERQAPEALESLKEYVDSGIVGDDVVWSIGTNGVLDEDIMSDLLQTVGADRRLWLVNLRTPNAKDVDNNALIESFADAHDNVYVIDWLGASEGHDDWFIEDGIHLTWDGRDAYANLVVQTMGYEVPSEANTMYNVTIMGDSVCLDAADALAQAYPRGIVDTSDGRTPAALVAALKGYVDQNVVGQTVVVAMADDEEIAESDLTSIRNAIGDRDLWLVNTRTNGAWGVPNNELLANYVRKDGKAHLVDWYAASEGHEDWFAEDGMHLSDAGAQGFAQAVSKTVVVADPLPQTEGNETNETLYEEGENETEETDELLYYGESDEESDYAYEDTEASNDTYETSETEQEESYGEGY